jgi:hypothetical protein
VYRYDGGADLIKSLILQVGRRFIKRSDVELFYATKSVHTFAECRKYPHHPSDRDSASKGAQDETLRISRVLGQTEVESGYDTDLKGRTLDLLIMEIPHLLDQSGRDMWPIERPLRGLPTVIGESSWAVVKTETPAYIGSPLFESINKPFSGRHIVIMSVNTMRRLDTTLVIGSLSWESTADAIRVSLNKQLSTVQPSAGMPHAVIVSIMNDGAACLHSSESTFSLLYDPKSIEGEWTQHRVGRMPGNTQCLTAAIAAGLSANSTSPDVDRYVQAGIQGGRELHRIGYVPSGTYFPTKVTAAVMESLLFSSSGDESFLPRIVVKANSDEVNWSILKSRFSDRTLLWGDIRERLFGLVRQGISKHLQDVPVVTFDKLTSVLREEMEGLRAIRGLMHEYGDRPARKRPLSIAVFGSPGSGKSFAVKAVAGSILHGPEFRVAEFNVSQFSEPAQLYGALHQVRDIALSGKMPLVFWDEFDCEFHGKYGWLRYFLAPMWDGQFTEGPVTHSVGSAVFVFAGGTSQDVHTFRGLATKESEAKGPDFLSRLSGFLNIGSLDHAESLLGDVLVRRAIVLRSLLLDYKGITRLSLADGLVGRADSLDVDDSVLTAFLCVKRFQYSVRSMEAILQMSRLQGKSRFAASFLPPAEQMNLHVDSSEWVSLLDGTAEVLCIRRKPEDPVVGW